MDQRGFETGNSHRRGCVTITTGHCERPKGGERGNLLNFDLCALYHARSLRSLEPAEVTEGFYFS
jgi:hypothetical protein